VIDGTALVAAPASRRARAPRLRAAVSFLPA
jgi:hypothetical protein